MKIHMTTNGVTRRQLLQGGLGSLAVVGLAACTSGTKKADQPTVTTTVKKTDHDRTALRTASSIEFMAVEVYKRLIAAKVITTPALADMTKLFMSQHQDHGDFIVAETKKRDGKAFEQLNSVLLQQLEAQLGSATNEAAALKVLLGVEKMAAATYLAGVGTYDDLTLNERTMSVGGVEARHVAVISQALAQPAAQDAFGSPAAAVTAGTGVG